MSHQSSSEIVIPPDPVATPPIAPSVPTTNSVSGNMPNGTYRIVNERVPVPPAPPSRVATPPSPPKKQASVETFDPNFFDFGSLNRFEEVPPKKNAPTSKTTELVLDAPTEKEEEDNFWKMLVPISLQETPSWLASLVVHVAIILLMALIPLSGQIRNSVSFIVGLGDEAPDGDELSIFEAPNDSKEVTEFSDPTFASLPEPTLQNLATEDFTPKIQKLDIKVTSSIRNGLTGRTGTMKGALLKAYGGTAGTEDAVAAGLRWLARQQRTDGSWSLIGPYTDGGVTENKPAATAMALLAFMGAGNTHKQGEYRDRVGKGIEFIQKQQDREGFFAEHSAGNQRTYAHAQCTMAICELYGMTGDEELRKAAQLAVHYCEKAQGPNGGWRYQPREGGDTSVTGWYVMALVSARMAGLDVDSAVLERVHEFLDSVQRKGRTNQYDQGGDRYAYQAYSTPTPAMTAEGMLCRLYLGWATKDPRIVEGAELLVGNPMSDEGGRISYYYWYYATTTLHHMGGAPWVHWNESMKRVLPAMQLKAGRELGSWPVGQDAHASAGGRLYATCFALYCLESYYRHLPLSEMAPR